MRLFIVPAMLASVAVCTLVPYVNALPVQHEDEVIWQSDLNQFDQFGFSLDLYGDRMIVGSIGANGASENSGAAYILERSSTTGKFAEVAKVWNSNPTVNQFAWRVAMHDDFAAAA